MGEIEGFQSLVRMIYPFLISIVFLNSAFVHGAKYVETVDVTDSKGKSFSCKYVISYTVSGGPNVGNSKAECSPNKDGGSVELMLSRTNIQFNIINSGKRANSMQTTFRDYQSTFSRQDNDNDSDSSHHSI